MSKTNPQTQQQSSGNTQAPTAVQMRLLPRTMERISNLVNLTGITNRTQIIATCIEIAEVILSAIKSGGKIYIERKDGTKELLKIVGA